MRPQTISQTGVGTSDVNIVDYRQKNFKIGVGCIVDGTATYTLEHTFDNTNWFPNEDAALVGATASQDGSYPFPIRASRINVTAGTGTVTATYIQGS